MIDPIFHLGTFEIEGRNVLGLVMDEFVLDLFELVQKGSASPPGVATLPELLGDWDRNLEHCLRVAEFGTKEEFDHG